jgi:hypothetical protein
MSTTPRTDEQVMDWTTEDGSDVVFASMARELETELAAMKARAEKAEAKLHALTLICGTNDVNKFQSWVDKERERAEKAEATIQKIKDVMREDSNVKDPMDAVEDIIAAMKEASK